ncbi:hypothetical protein ACS0TY_000386 [Phlomoides rotata]
MLQIRVMHTLIRDKDISKHDFVFYSNSLNPESYLILVVIKYKSFSYMIFQVVEHGLGHLPFTDKQVVTPTGSVYTGVDFCKKLCGVSIVRSGESMENALRACCKGIKIDFFLIHRDAMGRSLYMRNFLTIFVSAMSSGFLLQIGKDVTLEKLLTSYMSTTIISGDWQGCDFGETSRMSTTVISGDAFDTEQLLECVEILKSGLSVHVPIYDFKTHQRSSDSFRQSFYDFKH